MGLLGATALCFICMLKLVYNFEAEIEKKMKMKKVYSFIKHSSEQAISEFSQASVSKRGYGEAIDMEMIF